MSKTLRGKFTLALTKLGEKEVKRSTHYIVFTRNSGGFFYIGKSGALRFGATIVGCVPVTDSFKKQLLSIVEQSS